MRALRRDRNVPFRFFPPDCADCSQRLSNDERMLMALVKSARTLDPTEVLSSAIDLTGASQPSNVIRATVTLGAMLQRSLAYTPARGTPAGRLN